MQATAIPSSLVPTGSATRVASCHVGPVERATPEGADAYVFVVCGRAGGTVVEGAIAVDRTSCDVPLFTVAGDGIVVQGVAWQWTDHPLAPVGDYRGKLAIERVDVPSLAGATVGLRTLRWTRRRGRASVVDHDCIDADRDGVCAPADCDDTNPYVRPGAVDLPSDVIDQDCDGRLAGDADGDGHIASLDCDDADPTRWQPVSSYLDADGDGFGGYATVVCEGESVVADGDCDDSDPRIHPGATERDNMKDDDCDGALAEGETGRDAPAYQVVHGDVVRYLPYVSGPAQAVVGPLDDSNGTSCWVFHRDEGTPSVGGRTQWRRMALVACADGDEHLRAVAATPVPGEQVVHSGPVASGQSGVVDQARIEDGRLIVNGRPWTLHNGVLVTPRRQPARGLSLQVDRSDSDAIVNGGTDDIDIAGLVMRGPWMCHGCWRTDVPYNEGGPTAFAEDVTLFAAIEAHADGTRMLAPGETWQFDPNGGLERMTVWFRDGEESLWAGDRRVAP